MSDMLRTLTFWLVVSTFGTAVPDAFCTWKAAVEFAVFLMMTEPAVGYRQYLLNRQQA